MRYGYARISADDQNLDRQLVALAREDCAQVIEETGSGVKARHRLDGLLGRLQADDELVVIDLDRFGRATAELILMMDDLTKRGVVMRVLSAPSMDIRTDDGRLFADITAVLAAHELRRTKRRQRQGIDAAKAAGRHLGRPRKMTGEQIAKAREMLAGDESPAAVARLFKVDVKTVRATLKRND